MFCLLQYRHWLTLTQANAEFACGNINRGSLLCKCRWTSKLKQQISSQQGEWVNDHKTVILNWIRGSSQDTTGNAKVCWHFIGIPLIPTDWLTFNRNLINSHGLDNCSWNCSIVVFHIYRWASCLHQLTLNLILFSLLLCPAAGISP